jgi:hypothetical protein
MSIAIASVYADLLGTYGDAGNVLTLVHRARLYGHDTEVLQVQPGDALPSQADIYVLGGGEDTAQVAACNALRADGAINRAAARGAAVFAVCAGYQLLGEFFPDAEGNSSPGLGILDIRTTRLPQRAVGELAATAVQPAIDGAPLLSLDRVTGYENHAGQTQRGPQVQPLGSVLAGIGNGDGTEGSVSEHIIGTYLHGPALVRNPAIADQLLSWALGTPLDPIDEAEVTDLRAERLRTVLGG